VGFGKDGLVEEGSRNHVVLAFFLGLILGGIIFGSIHVAGWNLTFPTMVEQKLWRISSILITTLLPIVFLPHLCQLWLPELPEARIPTQVWGLVFGTLYIAARLFILVEIFRTLLYLPPDAYISTWASNVPHVA
jgi:hypothetical protein